MTYLELINAVLLRLRESSVTTIDANDYTENIAAMINEAKREVEDAWDWSHLRTSVDVTTTASTGTYSLTGCNERVRLQEAYNVTRKLELGRMMNQAYINKLITLSPQSGSPTLYDIAQYDYTNGVAKVRVYPTPDATETLRFFVVQPQAALSAASDILRVPSDPVIQGAYLRAINERGEDQGRLSETQALIYQNSLGSHIAIDANKFSDETTWLPT